MPQLLYRAGNFEISGWTDGHPIWSRISHNGRELVSSIHHNELKDLAYVIERMIANVEAALPPPYKHEVK